ncbi:SDR family NAD(P)-dependent oxidoreductase [Hoeflea marina]|uniref:SDR family NAD(P)-dependent oxidoreductase n=1 Tax=Hoeflea marina TaxID=274592 RepID=UPI001AECFEF9|nr:SDR family NAD(P)-dependent oxidoreductase [Hoeflea marina]
MITGGAGGLGRAMADHLQGEGWLTILIDRPGPGLDGLEQRPGRQRPIACDLTIAEEVARVGAAIRADHPAIDLAIYNAGITQIGGFADTPMAAHRAVFDVNYFGAVLMAAELIDPVRRARGTHLAISSVAGFAPLHHRTAYAASKHALQGFFTSLRSEESPFGVAVSIAAPSFIATNPGRPEAREGGIARPGSAPDGIDHMGAADAARIILSGARRRRQMIPVGRVARLSWLISRLSPRLFQALMERQMRKGR